MLDMCSWSLSVTDSAGTSAAYNAITTPLGRCRRYKGQNAMCEEGVYHHAPHLEVVDEMSEPLVQVPTVVHGDDEERGHPFAQLKIHGRELRADVEIAAHLKVVDELGEQAIQVPVVVRDAPAHVEVLVPVLQQHR